jgi:hypothetical protein
MARATAVALIESRLNQGRLFANSDMWRQAVAFLFELHRLDAERPSGKIIEEFRLRFHSSDYATVAVIGPCGHARSAGPSTFIGKNG